MIKQEYIKLIDNAVFSAERNAVVYNDRVMKFPALTSDRIKHLVNFICSNENLTVFMDAGCFRGATTISALFNNNTKAYLIDNFMYNPFEPNPICEEKSGWASVREGVRENMSAFGLKDRTTIISGNIHEAKTLKHLQDKLDVVFLDVTAETTYNSTVGLSNHFKEHTILISPNNRLEKSVENIEKALAYTKHKIDYKVTLDSRAMEDSNSWWNGVTIWLVSKEG